MVVIGLTGGLASGKTMAARHLAARGARRLDADRLGHESYAPGGPARAAVLAAFGRGLLGAGGEVDRAALAARVFGKPEELARLTNIVWPAIATLARARLAAFAREEPGGVVVLEAAVLLEAGWQNLVDEVWLVTTPRALALARACARDGATREKIEARMNAQLDDDARRARADCCFENVGAKEDLFAQLDRELARVTKRARAKK